MHFLLSNTTSSKIQTLRGIAIIAVVFIHSTPQGMPQVWCRPFVNFSVGLFLFLSGMLSNAECWNPQRRIRKIIIPYAIWTLVYVVISNYDSLSRIPIVYVKSFIMANSSAIMYYVFVYIQLTLLMPAIDKLSKSKVKWIGFLISPIEIIVMRLLPLCLGYEVNDCIAELMRVSFIGWFIYYYLGYIIGKKRFIFVEKLSVTKLLMTLAVSIALQITEGYWYLSKGQLNCGTQLKLSAIITGVVFVLLAYRWISSEKTNPIGCLKFIGDKSFGIFFCHLAIMGLLKRIPFYSETVIYPINAIVTIIASLAFVTIAGKVLGRYAHLIAF